MKLEIYFDGSARLDSAITLEALAALDNVLKEHLQRLEPLMLAYAQRRLGDCCQPSAALRICKKF